MAEFRADSIDALVGNPLTNPDRLVVFGESFLLSDPRAIVERLKWRPMFSRIRVSRDDARCVALFRRAT